MSNNIDISIDKEKLERCINLLSKLKKIECEITYSKLSEEDINKGIKPCSYPHYNYPEELFEVEELLTPDYNYTDNLEKPPFINRKIDNLDYSALNVENIRTVITVIFRGERFCDGSIARGVESGILLNSLLRLRDILD